MYAILKIFLRLSVILREILRIFVNTDPAICEQKVINFKNNTKEASVHTMDNFICNTLFCNQLLHYNHKRNYFS